MENLVDTFAEDTHSLSCLKNENDALHAFDVLPLVEHEVCQKMNSSISNVSGFDNKKLTPIYIPLKPMKVEILGDISEISIKDTNWPLYFEGDGAISEFYIKEFLWEYPLFFLPCFDFKNEIHDEGKSLDLKLANIEEQFQDLYNIWILLQNDILKDKKVQMELLNMCYS